jgi:hypothetical protein
MQLVARAEASRSTTEMLLDPFLNGLLHKFFLEKWRSFGRRLHYARTSLDALILFLLLHLAFGLKESPRNCNVRPVSTPGCMRPSAPPPHPFWTSALSAHCTDQSSKPSADASRCARGLPSLLAQMAARLRPLSSSSSLCSLRLR